MERYLFDIYNLFRKNYRIDGRRELKSISQYDPHKGFSKTQATKDFEKEFLRLIFEKNYDALRILIKETNTAVKNSKVIHRSYKTYCISFLDFLDYLVKHPTSEQNKKILKDMASLYHIDGNEKLVAILGGESKFIKHAVEQSYFFSQDCVYTRFDEILDSYAKKEPISARWQGERKPGVRPQSNYLYCNIDTNGNAHVRSVIRRFTKYSVSEGAESIFLNYNISHIWGNAVDPRYFTNLWNVALVPAWANDLLDKATAPPSTLASKMINTYKAIANRLYQLGSLPLQRIGINASDLAVIKDDVIEGTYTINIINKRHSKYVPGQIQTITITIKNV